MSDYMTAYISGPMTGIKDYNTPAFNEAEKKLRKKDYYVINPARLTDQYPGESWEFYMRKDIADICRSDIVFTLDGWENSKGSRLECLVAHNLGIPVVDMDFEPQVSNGNIEMRYNNE